MPGSGLDIKAGRQLYPAWLASEFIYVGALQPFRVMPASVSNLSSFRAFDGLSVNQTVDVGVGKATATVFGGRANQNSASPTTLTPVDAPNLIGASLTLKGDGFKARAQVSRSSVSLSTYYTSVSTVSGVSVPVVSNVQALNGKADTLSATFGANYDKDNIVVWAEYGTVSSSDGPMTGAGQFLKSLQGGYVLAGYRLGQFMPRYSYALADWSQSGISGIGKGTTHNIGLNYQATDQVVVKGDFQMDITSSGFSGVMVTNAAGVTNAKSFTVGVDFMF
jgi:hypothetical protein